MSESVQVGAQVPVDVAEKLAELARVNDRSIAGEIRLALRAHVEAEEKATA